jgi:hypothetical protein
MVARAASAAPKLSRQPRRDSSSNITATPLPRELAAVFRQGNCDPVHNLLSKKDDSLELMVQIKQRGQIMSALFDILYREYCRARLAEMRKQLLISPERHEVPEAICDANDMMLWGTSEASQMSGGGVAKHELLYH